MQSGHLSTNREIMTPRAAYSTARHGIAVVVGAFFGPPEAHLPTGTPLRTYDTEGKILAPPATICAEMTGFRP